MSDSSLPISDVINPSDFLDYNPETGELTRKPIAHYSQYWNKRFANKPLNGVKKDKYGNAMYIIGFVEGKLCLAHRLAWTIYYGKPPEGDIDHINGNGLDNRIENLRCVDATGNAKNRKISPYNRSGIPGVVWVESQQKWQVTVKNGGKQITIGRYSDFFEAACARKSAEPLYGYHANHGRENNNTQPKQRSKTMGEVSLARKLKEMTCQMCGDVFTARDTRAKFCSNRCRQADKYQRQKIKSSIPLTQ